MPTPHGEINIKKKKEKKVQPIKLAQKYSNMDDHISLERKSTVWKHQKPKNQHKKNELNHFKKLIHY